MTSARKFLSIRTRAALRLAVMAALVFGGGCRLVRKEKAAPSQTPTPAQADSARPVVAPPSRTDSVQRDSTADSVRHVAPPSDSARKADSVRAAADSVARATSALDSARRADSTARAAEARKKARPTTRNCVLDFADSPPETRLLYSRVAENVSNTFIGGGFVGHCQGENNRLRADSAEQFQVPGIVNLYGNVVYEEPGKIRIAAGHATYFTQEGRLYADGDVVATHIGTGSRFSGPTIEYYREMPDRPVARMIAPSRSTAQVVQKDSMGRLSPPTVIVANRFEDAGDSLLMAWGDVVIDRDQLNARADSSSFDKLRESARLVRGARVTNRDSTQRFTLVGDTIDLFSTQRQLDRVVAIHKANATSSDMILESEIIDIRLDGQSLKEAFAFGTGRSKAHTSEQDVEADSLRILMADKEVRQVHAVGGAVAIGTPDSTRIRTDRKDVLRGDRIFAYFDSTPRVGADSARKVRIREIRSLGNASSLFHMATGKGREAPPGINYVKGGRIVVAFDTGSVRTVNVDSSATGVYLEPEPDSLSDSTKKADSTKRPPEARAKSRPDSVRSSLNPPLLNERRSANPFRRLPLPAAFLSQSRSPAMRARPVQSSNRAIRFIDE